jgi:phage gp45-like
MYDLFRTELRETQDDGDQQTVSLYGVGGEELSRVHRVQPFGLSTHPPAGAHGIGMALHGRRDLAVVLGLEHAQYRPKATPAGGTVLYDMHGSAVSLVQNNLRVVHAQKIEFAVGGCTMTMTASGFEFTGGTIKHDGKSIDKNHIHGGVMSGPANTGVPAN